MLAVARISNRSIPTILKKNYGRTVRYGTFTGSKSPSIDVVWGWNTSFVIKVHSGTIFENIESNFHIGSDSIRVNLLSKVEGYLQPKRSS